MEAAVGVGGWWWCRWFIVVCHESSPFKKSIDVILVSLVIHRLFVLIFFRRDRENQSLFGFVSDQVIVKSGL